MIEKVNYDNYFTFSTEYLHIQWKIIVDFLVLQKITPCDGKIFY